MQDVSPHTMPIQLMYGNGRLTTNKTVEKLQTIILRIPLAKGSTTQPHRLEYMGCDNHNSVQHRQIPDTTTKTGKLFSNHILRVVL